MTVAHKIETLVNVEAEAALLGALMISNDLIDSVADIVSPDDFAEPIFADLYLVIIRERSLGRPANIITLRPFFENDPRLDSMGGIGVLANLTNNGAVMIGAKGFAEQIATLAKRRRLVDGLSQTLRAASDPSATVEELIDGADAAIFEATANDEVLHQPSGAACFDELINSFDEPVRGVTCGTIRTLDEVLGPLRPKQLIIGAGRPGMGKTACALSYALGAASKGHGVLFVSLEMSSSELAQRMAADMCFDGHAGVPFEAIRDNKLSSNQRREICRARDRMKDMPFHVIDAGKLSIGRLGMIVRRYKRRFAAKGHSLDLVIVDYLQLLSGDTKGRSNYETVSEVSRGLKAIAKDNGVAMFSLAQLSREAEKRGDKKPQLSDLRDSGQIEQDADTVLLLFRPEYYVRQAEPTKGTFEHKEWQDALHECLNRIDFIVAKRRNGRVGVSDGYFYGEFQAVRS